MIKGASDWRSLARPRTAATVAILMMGMATSAVGQAVDTWPAAGPGRVLVSERVDLTGASGATAAATQDPDGGHGQAPVAAPGFLGSIQVTGFVDGYYGWNFNRIGPALLRNFDVNHNEFSLNLAEIAVEKKPSAESRGGFRVDFDAGQALDQINAFEPGGSSFLKHVEQAYASYLFPAGTGLQLDFGKFVTPHGAEVIESRDNYNYSRGLLFSLAIPYYHMGARVSYAPSSAVTLTGFLVNGWNDVRDNNSGKTVGIGVALKPTTAFSFTQNYMVGPEQNGENDDLRHLFDSLVSYTLTSKVTLLGNFDYGQDRVGGGTVNWYGVAAYLRYQHDDHWAVTPRYEWFRDDDGFATGVPQDVQEVTLTNEYKLASSFITRLEFRRDFSNTAFFENDKGDVKKDQSTLTIGIIYAFDSKQ